MHSCFKLDHAGENCLAGFSSTLPTPLIPKQEDKAGLNRFVLPSAGCLQSVPLQLEVAKSILKIETSSYLLRRLLSRLSSVIGAIGLYRV